VNQKLANYLESLEISFRRMMRFTLRHGNAGLLGVVVGLQVEPALSIGGKRHTQAQGGIPFVFVVLGGPSGYFLHAGRLNLTHTPAKS